jgi:hypothetical protein
LEILFYNIYNIFIYYNIMSSSDTSSSPYVKSMTVAAPPTGSNGSIQQNNTALTNQNTQRQMAARFGGSRKVLKGGLVVPPVKVSYTETGVGNTSTANNVTASARTQADLGAATQYDSLVGPVQKAGRKKSRRLVGGWPEWGCMSGGKKRCKSCRKSRKSCKLKSCQGLRKSCKRLRKSSHRRRKSK